MPILVALVILSSFQVLEVLLLFSIRVIHPPSFQGKLIPFHFGALDLFIKKKKTTCDNMTAMRRRKLYFNLWLVRLSCLSSGLDHQNVLGLLTGISNINIFFIKKKKIVVIYCNSHDKFPSTNLTNNFKNKK